MFNYIRNKVSGFAAKKLIERYKQKQIATIIAELQPDQGIFDSNEILVLASMRKLAVEYNLESQWMTSNRELLRLCACVHDAFSIAETKRSERLTDENAMVLLVYFFAKYESFAHSADISQEAVNAFIQENIEYETNQYVLCGFSRYSAIKVTGNVKVQGIRSALSSIILQ